MKKYEVKFRIIPNSLLGILSMQESMITVSAFDEIHAKNQIKQMFSGKNLQILSCKEIK